MTKGERIKQLRERAGLTQDELATKLKVTKQTIYKYEKNIVTNIPSDNIEVLANILDSTPEYILGWKKAAPAEIKNSNTIADITDRMLKDSDFLEAVKFLNDLDQKQIGYATQVLNLFFKEGFKKDK